MKAERVLCPLTTRNNASLQHNNHSRFSRAKLFFYRAAVLKGTKPVTGNSLNKKHAIKSSTQSRPQSRNVFGHWRVHARIPRKKKKSRDCLVDQTMTNHVSVINSWNRLRKNDNITLIHISAAITDERASESLNFVVLYCILLIINCKCLPASCYTRMGPALTRNLSSAFCCCWTTVPLFSVLLVLDVLELLMLLTER